MIKNPIKAYLYRKANPGVGYCSKCKYPWTMVEGKDISPNDHSGCFPVCEDCFKDSELDELKVYYMGWYDTKTRGDIGFSRAEMLKEVEKQWKK